MDADYRIFKRKLYERMLVLWRYLVYTKDLRKDGETLMVPLYMVPLL